MGSHRVNSKNHAASDVGALHVESSPAEASPAKRATPTLRLRKKLLFSLIVATCCLAVLEGGLWLAGVQSDWERHDPYAGFVSHIPHFVRRNDAPNALRIVVADSKKRVLNPISFAPAKPPQTVRIVALGGSTTFGRPFFDQTSFAGWLRLWLPKAAPTQQWEVINAGAISYASYRVAGLMEEVAQFQPDLFIIYTGQNEFLERRTYDDLLRQPSWTRQAAALASHTRTASILRQGMESLGVLAPPAAPTFTLPSDVRSIPIHAVGPDAYRRDEELRQSVVAHFEASLTRMLECAERVGARALLVVPASNLADFAPFKSEFSRPLDASEQAAWEAHFGAARRLTQSGNLASALEELAQAAAIDDGRADLHFVRGQLLLGLNRTEEAATAFRRAKEEDVCPLRAIDAIALTIRRTAKERGLPVVDFQEVAAQQAAHGIPGRALFHDHVHPTIHANKLLALAMIERLAEAGVVQRAAEWNAEVAEQQAVAYAKTWDLPQMAQELLRLSALLITLNQSALAVEQIALALEYGGQTRTICKTAAQLLEQTGGGAATVSVFERYLAGRHDAAQDSAPGHYELGQAYLRRGQAGRALVEMKKALALAPDTPEWVGQVARVEAAETGQAEASGSKGAPAAGDDRSE